jgi:predicted CXXCH cytochrome family protein
LAAVGYRGRTAGFVAVALAPALAIAGCGARAVRSPDIAATSAGGARLRVRSNILRADYAGSERCAGCHADIYAAWRTSPMHEMTRIPEGAQVRAPFDGTTFTFNGDRAHFSQDGGERFVDLHSSTAGDHRYRVTRVIGGRYREDFAGVEVGAPGDAGGIAGDASAGRELVLPASYVFETKSFRLKGYSVLVTERPHLRAGGVWNQTCVFCHNTVPYFDSTWGALYGRGAPGYQGEVVDRLLPSGRRFRFAAAGEGGARALADAVNAEVALVGGSPAAGGPSRELLKNGIHELSAHFAARHFVEIGIGCEACHGGSREHADDPHVLPDFAPRARFLEALPETSPAAEVTRAERINRVCARCHQVLFSRYPFTWEGGLRRSPEPGGSSITSGEARDFLLGGCARAMSCVTCHDPHGEDKRADLERLATPSGNGVCVRCHAELAARAVLRAHAHHDPAGAGGSCVACHMPRKNMGLAYALTRYHRIGSPDDPVRVERDRPLECALCHADKTVGELVSTMETWWGKTYDRAMLASLYGSLDARPLIATLARGKAHEQAVAVASLAAAGVKDAVPAVARQMVNPYPLVRYYADKALAALRGERCAVDLNRPTAEIAAAVEACLPGAFPEGLPAESSGGRAGEAPADED